MVGWYYGDYAKYFDGKDRVALECARIGNEERGACKDLIKYAPKRPTKRLYCYGASEFNTLIEAGKLIDAVSHKFEDCLPKSWIAERIRSYIESAPAVDEVTGQQKRKFVHELALPNRARVRTK